MLLLSLRVALAHETLPSLSPGWMVDRWLSADGLPLDHMNHLALDPDGYVWVTTFDGLTRFDGASFTTWRRATTPIFRSNRFPDIAVDRAGQVWINDEFGTLYRFDPAVRPLAAEAVLDGVWHLAKDGDEVWAYSHHALWRIEETPQLVLRLPSSPEHRINVLGFDLRGDALVHTNGALHRVRRDGAISAVPLPEATGPLSQRYDVNPVGDAEGSVWVLHNNRLWRVVGGLVSPVDLGSARQVCGLFLREGAAWADTDFGLVPLTGTRVQPPTHGRADCGEVRLAAPEGVWHIANHLLLLDDAPVIDLQTDVVPRLVPDGGGGVWLATHRGLVHVRPAIAFVPAGLDQLGVDVVRVGQDGQVWASSEREIHLWDGVHPVFKLTAEGLGGATMRELPDGDGALIGRGARWRLQAGRLVSTGDLPPGRYEPGGSGPGWWTVLNGRTWVADPKRLHQAPVDGEWSEVRTREGDALSDVRDVVPLPEGRLLLLVGRQGLVVGPLSDLRRRGPPEGFPSVDPRGAWLDGSTVWLATEDAGLCRMDLGAFPDPFTAPVHCVTETMGLGEHNVHNGLNDGRGRLWLGTNRGVLVVEQAALDSLFAGQESSRRPPYGDRLSQNRTCAVRRCRRSPPRRRRC